MVPDCAQDLAQTELSAVLERSDREPLDSSARATRGTLGSERSGTSRGSLESAVGARVCKDSAPKLPTFKLTCLDYVLS